tara:strand:- start:547 stop:1128 length:582 start_codon:yes stop_codon:yes gene_type:complete
MKKNIDNNKGFTLIEVLVVVGILALLVSFLMINFNDARADARDKARAAALEQLAVALELYKAEYGVYPDQGCGDPSAGEWAGPGPATLSWAASCDDYIVGHTGGVNFVPDFLPALPIDPRDELEDDKGFYYRTSASNDTYKIMVHESVEVNLVDDFSHELARCPRALPGPPSRCSAPAPENIYSIYSSGAEYW